MSSVLPSCFNSIIANARKEDITGNYTAMVFNGNAIHKRMARHLHTTVRPFLRDNQITGRTPMNTMLLKMYVKFQDLMNREEGQDLVEYALVLALIALGATVSMKTLATNISTAFSNIATALGT